MEIEIKKYLFDIKTSISNIDLHLNFERNFIQYSKNLTVKRAVERELEIIGEALNRIVKLEGNIEITNVRNIIGLRNRVIHSYDAIDDNLIWKIIIKDLPVLKIEVDRLME